MTIAGRRLFAAISGVAVVIIAVAVTVVVLTRSDSAQQDAEPTVATASQALNAAADVAADRTDTELSYLRTATTSEHEWEGRRYAVTEYRTTRVDAATTTIVTVDAGEPAFSDPADRRAWRDAGSPPLPGLPAPAEAVQEAATVRVGDTTVPLTEAGAAFDLPPKRLLAVLASSDPKGDAFTGGIRVLLTPGLPSTAEAHVLRALATVSGTGFETVDRELSTPSGLQRSPVRVLTRPGDLRVELDARSGRIIDVAGLDDTHVSVGATGFINCLELRGVGGPAEINVGCATGAYLITDIEWAENWGGPVADGDGTATVRDCTPDCASGVDHEYPVELELGELRECGYNIYLYTRLTIRYTAAVPPDHDRVESDDYAC